MSIILFRCIGGSVVLPDAHAVLIDRVDGGNLVVNPPRPVWERSELSREELVAFSCLVAATGRAMLESLSQLAGGCLNYWEAGNWALNDDAPPVGKKNAREFRQMHLHLLGRNPLSTNPRTKWGEAPLFPVYADKTRWAAEYQRLTSEECVKIIAQTQSLLISTYAFKSVEIDPYITCHQCGYPCATSETVHHTDCAH